MVAPPLAGKRVWILPIVLLVAALMVLPSGAVLAGHAGHAVPGGGTTSSAAAVSSDGAGSALAARLSGISLPHPSNLAGSLASSLSSLTSTAPPARQLTSSFAAAGGAALPPTAGTTDLSARLAKVNSTFAGIPDSSAEAAVARLVAAGTIPARAVYLPNQKLLSEPATAPVTPTYNVSPAPMGIADFGLSSDGAYTVYTPDVLGSLTLNGYNASGGSLYQDTGAYYWDGLSPNAEVTPWQSGVQLNTVVTNVSYPGSNTGVFWTQNVVDFSGNTLQFVDNVWNFTSPNAGLNASTLYSYDGNWVVGEFYYAYGPTLPISFPMTIDLYNNASNVNGRTTVTFGYRVTEGSAVFTGIYDTVVFNSKPTTLEPLLTPHYLIDGNQPTYTVAGNEGPLYDAELVFGGPGDGSNSVITSLNGSMNLNYLLGSTWTPAHAAYDYGADTGETAIGFAGWWQGSTEYVNQGPSILYGLWNTTGAVPTGNTQFIIHNNPSYAFDFVGTTGSSDSNLSYAPTEPNGTAQTWLPPTAVGYNFSTYADGFDPVSFALPLSYSEAGETTIITYDQILNPGLWDAPVYMDGPAQALALATDATGWTSGPYLFENLAVNVSLAFNHLNDWGFPEFDLFWAYSPGAELVVSNITQGTDSAGGLCSPIGDAATCYLEQFPFGYADLPEYGSQIADWNSSFPIFENLLLEGYYIPNLGLDVGAAVSLWNVTDAFAYNVTSLFDTWGVWAANSPGLAMVGSFAVYAAALSLSDSPYAYVFNVSAVLYGAGVINWGSAFGEYYFVNATYASVAFEGVAANDSSIQYVTAVDSQGVYLENSSASGVFGLNAFDDSLGVYALDDTNSTIGFVYANDSSEGLEGYGLVNTTFGYFEVNDSEGAFLYDTYNTSGFVFYVNDSFGVGFLYGNNATVEDVTADNLSVGVVFEAFGSANASSVNANDSLGVADVENFDGTTNVSYVNATNGSTGVLGLHSDDLYVHHVTANSTSSEPSTGVALNYSDFEFVTNVSASGYAFGVNVSSSEFIGVSNVTSTWGAIGVLVNDSFLVEIDHVAASHEGLGVGIENSEEVDVWNVTATDPSAGTEAIDSAYVWVWNTTVTSPDSFGFEGMNVTDVWVWNTTANDSAIGVAAIGSRNVTVYNTTVTNLSIGVVFFDSNTSWANNTTVSGWSVGVALVDSLQVHATNVTATDPYVTSPWLYSGLLGAPTSAVVTIGTVDSTVADVTATDYPVALYDNSSFNLFVQGISATDSGFGVMLNGTEFSVFSAISARDDGVGVQIGDATECGECYAYQAYGNVITGSSFVGESSYGVELLNESYDNVVTSSSFVNDTSYGVALLYDSYGNLVYNNDFLGNNGASGVYNATHIQAYSANGDNAFNNSADVGNYWADWHTYVGGVLAPYPISSGAWDYHPLGAPEGTYALTFTESGLAGGTWSVTVDGTTTTAAAGVPIVINEYPGTYTYAVAAVAGYAIAPSAGTVLVTTGAVNVAVDFSALYTVSFTESGLPSDTSWSVVLNGVLESGTGTLTFSVVGGTYSYTVLAPSGWAADPSAGTVTVGGAYLVPVTFTSTVPPTYTVTVEESGLTEGTSWSAIFNGVQESGSSTSLTFTVVAGTYSYQVGAVTGYTVSPSSGTTTVSGPYTISVVYTSTAVPTVTVQVHETGLASGASWGAYVDGTLVTGAGATLIFTVPADGSYAYQVVPVANYTVSPSGGTVTVGSSGYTIGVTFTQVTYAVTFSESGLAGGASWTVTVGASTYTTSGTSVTVDLPNGSYSYTFGAVSGYTLSAGSGTVKVAGSATGAAVSYGTTTTPSYVGKSTFNTDWALALGLAALGIVIALVALLRKPRTPTPAPATAWQEPPPAEGAGSGPSGGTSGH